MKTIARSGWHRGQLLLLCLSACISVLACQAGDAQSSAPQAVNSEQAAALIRAGARVIDVRSAAEWHSGHLSMAEHRPIDSFADSLISEPLRADQPLLLYCKSGGRAGRAASLLQQQGDFAVSYLRPGGYAELKAAGLPVTEPESVSP